MEIKKLAIAVTFHYASDRIKYLEKIATQFNSLGNEVFVHIFTNENGVDKMLNIMRAVKQDRELAVNIHTPTYLGHPYLLTWSHFHTFRELFNTDESISHFMYLEDDIFITKKNIEYWLRSREALRNNKVIPSFLRYEEKEGSKAMYATDVKTRSSFDSLPKVKESEIYYYLNLPQPYQGMYLLDRELMYEHLNGPSSIPECTPWGIREKAAAGLTFVNVPKDCHSRNFIGYDFETKCVDPNSLIHHLPNNYVSKMGTLHGKIKVDELIIHAD
ncbi:hypothetical protein [Polynucleobacter hallstattensis]|uniref:hypothetical protein n=1 Tax=Polynucleobacter hallstattensis TaxID=1855586 RepID=UPI001C0DF83F|nr:hypothetical protein [Polynucleobacter hallstattensis]MBU3560435.1 hypothetical protein [Polynucleobacter hallstattensis]